MMPEEKPKMRERVRRRHARPPGEAPPEAERPRGPRPDFAALGVFALIMVAAPLAFGAVDRIVQIGLLILLSVGLFLKPPAVVSPSRWGGWLVLALAAVLVLKEFLPASFFGSVSWRTTLVASYGLPLPWTHHPEPGRALDALLAATVGTLWFLWARTLAGSRENQPWFAWTLFLAAVVVAIVSIATKDPAGQAIYGLRYTPGWRGFGPFPNRNHTASFLAMGTVLGFGGLAWAGARRRYLLLAMGAGLTALPLAALMMTQSRGGLVALGVGCGLYTLLLVCKLRSRRALALIATVALAAVALVLAFGGPLLARFAGNSSEISNQTRVRVWSDAALMWHDAPLFGHGAGAFGSIFPMYQRIELDNQVVLHPESSWLQWLAELGLVPVALAVAGALLALPGGLRAMFARRQAFYLMAAGLAAGGGLLAHAAIDVPAHRWATAGFALAALALAFPAQWQPPGDDWNLQAENWNRAARRAAWVPLLIAGFWAFPLWLSWPRWSPLESARVVAQAQGEEGVSIAELEAELTCFPLDAQLHELRGFHELLRAHPREEVWLRHFRTAQRLLPGSSALAINQAQTCADLAPEHAVSFWQQAIERGGWRDQEIFGNALGATRGFPGAMAAWSAYVRAHPELALTLAQNVPEAEGRSIFALWWRERGSRREVPLEDAERKMFYRLAPRWSDPAQFDDWMRQHANRVEEDYRAWAEVLHAWHDEAAAWKLLAKRAPEPPWPASISIYRSPLWSCSSAASPKTS